MAGDRKIPAPEYGASVRSTVNGLPVAGSEAGEKALHVLVALDTTAYPEAGAPPPVPLKYNLLLRFLVMARSWAYRMSARNLAANTPAFVAVIFGNLGATNTARIPKSTMTITSSMRVNPPDFGLWISDRIPRGHCGLLINRMIA
jgi:hypothetical protein